MLQQPLPHLGQVSEKVAAGHPAGVLPVPPHPAGRYPGGGVSGAAAAGNPKSLKLPLDFDAPSTDTVYIRRDVYGVFHSGTVAPVRGDHPHPAPVRPDWPIVNPKT